MSFLTALSRRIQGRTGTAAPETSAAAAVPPGPPRKSLIARFCQCFRARPAPRTPGSFAIGSPSERRASNDPLAATIHAVRRESLQPVSVHVRPEPSWNSLSTVARNSLAEDNLDSIYADEGKLAAFREFARSEQSLEQVEFVGLCKEFCDDSTPEQRKREVLAQILERFIAPSDTITLSSVARNALMAQWKASPDTAINLDDARWPALVAKANAEISQFLRGTVQRFKTDALDPARPGLGASSSTSRISREAIARWEASLSGANKHAAKVHAENLAAAGAIAAKPGDVSPGQTGPSSARQ
jgi:hypothetical protein